MLQSMHVLTACTFGLAVSALATGCKDEKKSEIPATFVAKPDKPPVVGGAPMIPGKKGGADAGGDVSQ